MDSVDTLVMRLTVEGPGQVEFVAQPRDNSFEGEESPSIGARLILPKTEWVRMDEPKRLRVVLNSEEDS